jgi:hypothetical protein
MMLRKCSTSINEWTTAEGLGRSDRVPIDCSVTVERTCVESAQGQSGYVFAFCHFKPQSNTTHLLLPFVYWIRSYLLHATQESD